MPRLTPENKEFHTAQMRENICRVFAEMFAAKGDVSMEHLAERVGIAKGTIYNYFKAKLGNFNNTIDGALSLIDGNGYAGYSDDY